MFLVYIFVDLTNAKEANIALVVIIVLNLNNFLYYLRGNISKDVGNIDSRSSYIIDFDVNN
jgi:hypothetical protein